MAVDKLGGGRRLSLSLSLSLWRKVESCHICPSPSRVPIVSDTKSIINCSFLRHYKRLPMILKKREGKLKVIERNRNDELLIFFFPHFY